MVVGKEQTGLLGVGKEHTGLLAVGKEHHYRVRLLAKSTLIGLGCWQRAPLGSGLLAKSTEVRQGAGKRHKEQITHIERGEEKEMR